MRKFIVAIFAIAAASVSAMAAGRTLRIDYIFSGDDKTAEISLDGLCCFDGWAGRNVNTSSVLLRGNGQITMRDRQSGEVLWCNSFSTLFQEWQATEEATRVRRSFENVFLLPMPESTAVVKVELYGLKGEVTASFGHIVDPSDILIRRLPLSDAPCRKLLKSGSPRDCIDVAIVAEGYTAEEAGLFYSDAKTAMDEILSYEPFSKYRDRFNFIAVALPSDESGVSVPKEGLWKKTALGSHFSTFYSDRYLTTLRLRTLHDALAGLDYEHIIILANTDTYGGGGIYNSYTLTTARHPAFKPVVVHEFGHSFAGLADEYYYDDQYVEMYYPDAEPWEKNISTLKDFGSKWYNLLPRPLRRIISEPVDAAQMWEEIGNGVQTGRYVGIYEGAGYQSKGVYRGFPDCRMHTNTAPIFCPVCQQAISELIEYNTEEKSSDK